MIEAYFIEIEQTIREFPNMDENQVMIFRYDNAPHHAEVSTFPHHKHEGDDIKESPEIILCQVLLEISQRQR
ncbi:MAG: hypothetical protein IM516_05895 [Pseudanabaena sp. M158S2SP1A06QC]|jgi:hypothetical protein|uniref:toxin-antitoxin system TumE family protein n=1 Tax=Pseudanabaena mucicola TaxID=71190 RepID=UPI002577F06E|nr:DUF6516 family protein [Pseudanabaena mucicola]MCA6562022.1 hypothetical protein [Pseudanabaena sp. M079S1SP2A07QC]MCA6575116.1 hypothetical protein [Pseudanabaena sp. M53BS1SP1A06MG]MCA6581916.1 hypothetical protein [Pseudanabaena sp. M34BS1SP1A06MG]MCA6593275.1 hypothetical protein [Pseudanabaena sp. M38BS1SP1A06MG]MCA6597295.1 hypothetical protein [Pseudanabaena sp. M046S1SP1A06QC]MCA6601688.1 hypothetical protein [Pseudanabaena sp. M57BS1SP1A06MG]MCA6606185.1 hypothetical protein [Pse